MPHEIASRSDVTGRIPTASEDTIAQYEQTAKSLLRQCAAETDNEVVTPAIITEWFCHQHERWARRTVVVYRCSLKLHVSSSLARGMLDLPPLAQLLEAINKGPRPRRQKRNPRRRTAADKARTVIEMDARRIFAIANACKGLLDKILSRYVKFGAIFGLRPGEWRHAALRRDRWLVVRNGKHSNGRGNGKYRIFDLSILSREDRQQIGELIRFIRQATAAAGSWKRLNKQLAARLQRICEKAGLWRTCLYAFRGTASSRLAARAVSRAELAAFLGHVSDASQRHYPTGRGLRGWSKTPVILPDMRYIRRVREQHKQPPWELDAHAAPTGPGF